MVTVLAVFGAGLLVGALVVVGVVIWHFRNMM